MHFSTDDGSDYDTVTTFMRFTPTDVKPCVRINITDDVQVEQTYESFLVSLQTTESTPDGIELSRPIAELAIVDNDGKFSTCLSHNTLWLL